MKAMDALAQLRGMVMSSVLPCTPAHADALLNAVGAGLAEADDLRARLDGQDAATAPAKKGKHK